MHITRLSAAPSYVAPLHENVGTFRLQGHEASETKHFWVGLSYYLPAGAASSSPTREETVYVVLEGSLVITCDGREESLEQFDSVHLDKGEERSLENRTARPATLLVIIAQDPGGQ